MLSRQKPSADLAFPYWEKRLKVESRQNGIQAAVLAYLPESRLNEIMKDEMTAQLSAMLR